MPLHFRSLEKGLPFPILVYYFSSPRASLLSKFDSAFKVTKKNNKDCKETFKKYSFKKLRREACTSEQVGPIFISDTKKEREWDDLQQQQKKDHHIKRS